MCMSCWSDFRCRKQHLQILANKTKKQFVYTLLITPSEQISIYIFSFYHRYDWIMFVCVTERNVTHPSYLSPEGNWENFIQRTQQRNTYPMQIQCCSFDITFHWSFITRHTHTHTHKYSLYNSNSAEYINTEIKSIDANEHFNCAFLLFIHEVIILSTVLLCKFHF